MRYRLVRINFRQAKLKLITAFVVWNDYYGAINKGVSAKNYESDSGAKKRT